MTPRKRRMMFVGGIVAGTAIAVGLAILAIGENMLHFKTPTQITNGEAPTNQTIRVGGLVVDGSVRRESGDLTVQFDLTDNNNQIAVHYSGILPDLFREGQGVIAIGKLTSAGHVVADEVLAKHDENYMPPEVHEALKAGEAQAAARGS